MDFGEIGWNGEVRLPYVRSPQNFRVRPLDQPPLPHFVPNLCPWQSFELATPGHLILARYMDYIYKSRQCIEQIGPFGRCHKNDSWLRGRVLEMTPDGVRVFYMDCGRIEVHSEPQRLADIPLNLCSRLEVLQCTLDPALTWSRLSF